MRHVAGSRWREKLPPIFFDVVGIVRQFEEELALIKRDCDRELFELGQNPPGDRHAGVVGRLQRRAADLQRRVEERLAEIDRKHGAVPFNPSAYAYLYSPDGELGNDTLTLARFLHWMRHRESLDAAAVRDRSGDLKAWKAIARTAEDHRGIVHRKGIKPFQGDAKHRELLQMILCFATGALTPEELEACFDEVCGCGKSHDADALRKQFKRLKRDLGV
jgi:hypothetical protein